MSKIDNLEEKRLIIARYFIKMKDNGMEFQDKDLFDLWNKYFPDDFRLKRKKYNRQRFIHKGETSEECLTLADTKGIRKSVIDRYCKKWNTCCSWINDYITNHNLEECEKELVALRKNHELSLKFRCNSFAYDVKIYKFPIDRLSTYCIYTSEDIKRGNYDKCIKYIKQMKLDMKR